MYPTKGVRSIILLKRGQVHYLKENEVKHSKMKKNGPDPFFRFKENEEKWI